jgi:nucleoid DNA-binding protein
MRWNIPKLNEIFQNEMKDFKFKSKIIQKVRNIHNEYSHHEKQEIQQFGSFQIHMQNEEEFWNMSWNSKKRWNISEADEIY